MKKITFVALSLILIGLIFYSCKKEDNAVVVDNAKVTSIAKTIGMFNTDNFDQLATDFKSTQCHCLNIIPVENEDGEHWPFKLIFDFGEENCEFLDGIFMRGKIHFSLSDIWTNEGSVKIFEFEDYYINDINLYGKKTFTNTGYNEEQHLTWQIDIEGAGIKDTVGNEKTWNATLYAEFIEGSFKNTKCHYSYIITGSGNGTDNGVSYTAEITEPLLFEFGCWYPKSGVMTIEIGGQTVVIDYGEGECDNKATMHIGDGEPEEITLGF
ncbi:MAG: hypothetical protein HC831_05735 [Chloroflexia bacterium]|nr:hypothetical protein [Chloroflexia bacterium]